MPAFAVKQKQAAHKQQTVTVSALGLSAWTGLTDRRHRQLAEQGFFPAPIRGQYQIDATLTGLFRHLREQLARKNDDLSIEQQKLARARREKTEVERDLLKGDLLHKDQVGPALRNLALHQRATLQYKLEQELAPGLAGKTPVEILQEVRRAVDAICLVFEEGTKKWMISEP